LIQMVHCIDVNRFSFPSLTENYGAFIARIVRTIGTILNNDFSVWIWKYDGRIKCNSGFIPELSVFQSIALFFGAVFTFHLLFFFSLAISFKVKFFSLTFSLLLCIQFVFLFFSLSLTTYILLNTAVSRLLKVEINTF
jgi:hypothetical protein